MSRIPWSLIRTGGVCVVELIEKAPCDGVLPVVIGDMVLREYRPAAITAITPFAGQEPAVQDNLGVSFPAPGQVTGSKHLRLVWTGPGQAMAIGHPVSACPGAAVVDQSAGWACLVLEGVGAVDVLARLVPVDLRERILPVGRVVRTLLGHMHVVLIRHDVRMFEMLVFRSMAATAVREIEVAMKSVAGLGTPRLL